MKFLKQILAVVVGIFTFLFVVAALFLFFGFIGSLFQKSPVQSNSVLLAKFNTTIEEKAEDDPFANFPVVGEGQKIGLNQILNAIDKAKADSRIKGIYLELSNIPAGFASIEAIRKEILSFKESGKFVIAYGERISQKAYYLASIADTVIVNPKGLVEFTGLSSELMFFKNALEKLGIEPQVFKVGDFKSAVEPFIRSNMSYSNRLQIKEMLDDFYSIYLNGIAENRNISVEELKGLSNNGKIQNAEDAVSYGLADLTAFKSDVYEIIANKLGYDNEKRKLNFVSFGDVKLAKDYRSKKLGKNKIAVVYAYGSIVDGPGKNGTIGGEDYQKIFRKIRFNERIKATVIRVNSGGGSALASEIMWDEIERLKEKMPVVVSMGDYAASGGYYIACNSDKIFAEKNTLTGSIGVFGIFPNMKKFWNEKVGITFDTEKTSRYADIGSINRPVTSSERTIIQNSVNDIYATFLTRVADGREMDVEDVHEIAKGRVWSGLKAKELGLVDEIGGLKDAIEAAAELAEIDGYRTFTYPKAEDPFQKFMKGNSASISEDIIKKELGIFAQYRDELKQITELNGIQTRMPFKIEIK